MTTSNPPVFRELTRRYIHPQPTIAHSRFHHLVYLFKWPFTSWSGGRKLAAAIPDAIPGRWQRDFEGRKVLIVGSGPSLDRVEPEFFAQFDTVLYINFAVRRALGGESDYFFTTDIGPVREYLDAYDDAVFRKLGPERCILAPIFLDQYRMLTERGRATFSMMAFDKAEWRAEKISLGPLRLPLRIRYHPRQPEWETYTLPPRGRRMPVMDHTSALTATAFAAMMGASEIGLIGCDFSVGRASSVASAQVVPDASIFAAAPAQFRRIEAAMARQGLTVTNHSWLV